MCPLIFTAAIFLTALMLCCIWVASDADDYSEIGREKNGEEKAYWQ